MMEILKIVQKIHSDERIAYIDVLRIISAFAVIIVHVTANDWANAFHDSMWHIYNVYRASVNWCNPVFVMVSGVFFLDPCKILSIEKLYKKYILRIMLAIAFWGLFYYLPDIVYGYVCKSGTITGQTWLFVAKKIVFGVPWHHLWYLYMIIGLYMLAPLYRIFSRFASKKDFVYLLLVFVVFGSILPMIKSVLAFFHYESSIYFSVEQAATWTGYFFAGYFFSKYEISRKSKYAIYVAGLLSPIFTVLGTACFSAKNNAVTGIFCGAFSPTTVFQSFALFLLVKSIGRGGDFASTKICAKRIVGMFGRTTFGIYLIHAFVLRLCIYVGLTSRFVNPAFAIPLVSALIFIVSFALIFLFRKLPLGTLLA